MTQTPQDAGRAILLHNRPIGAQCCCGWRYSIMQSWGFWEWLAYAGIFIAASILAISTGLKLEPKLMEHFTFTESPIWGFVPLALVVIASLILIVKNFDFLGRHNALAKPCKAWRYVTEIRLRLAADRGLLDAGVEDSE
jgi:hypothetical protein